MSDNDKFNYSYTALDESQRREIESIKRQYVSKPQEDKLTKLRKLNKRVSQPPLIAGLTIGIIGTLILGVGMAMVLVWGIMVWGVIVGILGLAIASTAYPVYKLIFKRNKRKYGRQIVELSDELLNTKQ